VKNSALLIAVSVIVLTADCRFGDCAETLFVLRQTQSLPRFENPERLEFCAI